MQGTGDALHKSTERGFPLTGISIILTHIEIHPVDSNSKVCRRVAQMVLRECLEDNLVAYTAIKQPPCSSIVP